MDKKVMATFALLIVALSVIGFAYAHWSGQLYIEGTVNMGELIFGFTTCGPCGDGKMVDGRIVTPEPKDIGEITCNLLEPETSVHLPQPKTVYKKLNITITKAYPEYVAWCNFTLDNGGTIPLDVYMYCVTVNTGDGLRWHWKWVDGLGWMIEGFKDLNENGEWDEGEPILINIWFEPMFFGQIDPCESKNSRIYIHIKEPAEPCHTYKFEISITAYQWNWENLD
ncbi:MAG: hypothetical protein QXH40_05665 [Candidatus Bathyarchaeia archaeon]